jgi:ATP-dependent Clp protease ATP-binding subunit ClpB
VIDFKNTIIFLTSNSKNPENEFKPEILGRLDARLVYQSIGKEIGEKLLDRQIELLNSRLHDRELKISLTSKMREEILSRGQSDSFGARPLASVFHQLVTRPLSEDVLKGNMPAGGFKADWNNENSVIEKV